ncbi:hypothetical protein CSC70_06345 [Pseudoxanthomonas kalamensis DSM 18571]|uniref:hypothetical protein n=1 Tax=Pseudoxanthomonas kalamensis TaxID=289483 RepID=UPI0013918741|nr:hypothetical protein [Pseudoxanthomonas kalamensis]KAF1710310.1 hypothetical protein CSC70_06345 [Pseudoxanthomonas kalamensis DSM 18571]
MYPISPAEYRRRLAKWNGQPDRRCVRTRDDRGRPVVERWSTGVCRLRAVWHPDGVTLWGDRGDKTLPRVQKHGKIAFTYFGE